LIDFQDAPTTRAQFDGMFPPIPVSHYSLTERIAMLQSAPAILFTGVNSTADQNQEKSTIDQEPIPEELPENKSLSESDQGVSWKRKPFPGVDDTQWIGKSDSSTCAAPSPTIN